MISLFVKRFYLLSITTMFQPYPMYFKYSVPQDWIGRLIRECNHELEKFPAGSTNQELSRPTELRTQIDKHKQGNSCSSSVCVAANQVTFAVYKLVLIPYTNLSCFSVVLGDKMYEVEAQP